MFLESSRHFVIMSWWKLGCPSSRVDGNHFITISFSSAFSTRFHPRMRCFNEKCHQNTVWMFLHYHGIFSWYICNHKGTSHYLAIKYSECNKNIPAIIKHIIHYPVGSMLVTAIQFQDPYCNKMCLQTFIATEGMHSGILIHYGQKMAFSISDLQTLLLF